MESEMILSYQVYHYDKYQDEMRKVFVEAVKTIGSVPGKIVTIRPEICFALDPFETALGFELVLVEHIPLIEKIKKDFFKDMKGKKGKNK